MDNQEGRHNILKKNGNDNSKQTQQECVERQKTTKHELEIEHVRKRPKLDEDKS